AVPRWTPAGAGGGERDVDFGKHVVVAVFKGKGTDHDGIRIEGVFKVGGKVVVEYREFRARAGGALAESYPCHVVVVEKLAGDVEFKRLPYLEGKGAPVP